MRVSKKDDSGFAEGQNPYKADLRMTGSRERQRQWHGAKKDSWFSHVALEVPGEGCSNEWCERVIDEEYAKLEG